MRRAIFTIIGTVIGLVLLLSFKTHPVTGASALPPAAVSTPSPSASSPSVQRPTSPRVPATRPSSRSRTRAAGPAKTAPVTRTVTGAAVDTPYGPVQIGITVRDHRISAVTPVQVPMDTPRDQEINDYAVPALMQETLSAQSAHIDMISGATYTSDGYIRSLQSAIDKAGSLG